MQWKTLDEEDVVSTCSLAQQGGPPGEAQSPAFNCSALLRVNLLFYLWALSPPTACNSVRIL